MAKPYVCTLDEASLKKAKEELYEDPADRMSSVENLRKLVKERPYITCDADDAFFIKFLRVAKFSQLEAMNRLERYLTLFNSMPKWMRDIDTSNPRQLAFIETGYYVPLGYNDEGQMVNLYNFGSFDPKSKKYSKDDIARGLFSMMLYQAENESIVVNGASGLGDLTIFTVKHQTYWSINDIKTMADLMNGSMPLRWKEIYYYNAGPVFEVIWNMFTPFLKKKMKERLILVGSNLEVVYDKKIPMRLLPVEYLPDDYTGPNNGHLKDLIEKMKSEMSKPETVARIKYLTSDAFRLDESKRPKNEAPLQSFRKLNVD